RYWPTRRLLGTSAPTVHLFVTVCGEDEEVILDTFAAAAVQNYPKHSFRVFVLDDANQSSVRLAVEAFNVEHVKSGYLPVVYEARHKEPGVPHYYKAGNLHNGIQLSRAKYGGSEFIAGLDADQIPQSDWLQLTVPHLLAAPGLALVSPPQFSYDVPADDALAQDHGAFHNIWEPLRNRRGVSQCNGSGYIIRRAALESIAGWPLCNVGEDIICSARLLQNGWSTVFVPDRVQAGMAPGSFHALIAQRLRWV
ncbi:glycosyltransferase family 2 protein, partial [Cercospora zeae-maydis SCOH1-5]